MNIKILDSWLREYLKTKATPKQIGEYLSLTSCSVERIEPYGKNDVTYDIEVTTNRPDLMSVIGLARETAAILPQFKIAAEFTQPKLQKPSTSTKETIKIVNDSQLVNRICAVIMDVSLKPSPQIVKDRIESSDIRSLNNLIDITNYVMREIGHPTHVFDYDRLISKKLIIRESKKGEKIVTLDKKEHSLPGGDIIADNGTGEIVDLLGVMGTLNSVVTNDTKRILFFIDDNDPARIRKTSMSLAIRSEAAQLNEKGVDPELSMPALLQGIAMFKEFASGTVVSDIIDIYPNKPKKKMVSVTQEKISTLIGVSITTKRAEEILSSLGFKTSTKNNIITADVPSWRLDDIHNSEDLIEEIARVYGYHNIPNVLPSSPYAQPYNLEKDTFSWEYRAKEALKYWGFTETYTYSLVSEELFQGSVEKAVTIANPLNEELVYMRNELVPSLLQVLSENKTREEIKLFEIANIYHKKSQGLPDEKMHLAGLVKSTKPDFFKIKGYLQQLATDSGIENLTFKKHSGAGTGADLFLGTSRLGIIEITNKHTITFEIDFELFVSHATLKKIYNPIAKYPPILEDIAIIVDEQYTTAEIVAFLKQQDTLIRDVELFDHYNTSRAFHITYQHPEKNLTMEDIIPIRKKLLAALEKSFNATLRS